MTNSLLRATGLCVDIAGNPVLRDVSVSFIPGAVTAIVGPNGAGKSTLLEALAGVRLAARGTVERSGDVALVVQRVAAPDALPLTVQEVVAMGTWGAGHQRRGSGARGTGARGTGVRGAGARGPASAAQERVASALERVELSELAARPFSALSGGQRQRALLAQGLARRAEIFLLDEPAAGLDVDSRHRMQLVLREEADRGALVACVTHDAEAIAAADHRLCIESGAVAGI